MTSLEDRADDIRAALIADPFATIREVADETGLGETQITTALRRVHNATLNEFRRKVHADFFDAKQEQAA